MPQQPELTSHPLPASPLPASPAPPPGTLPFPAPAQPPTAPPLSSDSPQRIPRWLQRAELFLRVLLRMYIGLAVCIVPWWPLLWDRNPLLLQFPTVAIYATNGMVRGLISGLGLLNLWIAFQDALRHGADSGAADSQRTDSQGAKLR